MSIEQAIRLLHPETTAEAIAEIKYYGGFHGNAAALDAINDACIVACEALEKQIPKKPLVSIEELGMHRWRCPNCNGYGTTEDYGGWNDYCCDCGQAIDWGEEE